jgi:hypothetical protein
VIPENAKSPPLQLVVHATAQHFVDSAETQNHSYEFSTVEVLQECGIDKEVVKRRGGFGIVANPGLFQAK